MLQIVRFQIPHQKIAERALPDGRQPILITPDSVNGIQLLGGDRHIRFQPDIAGGFHKVDGVVGVTLDVLPIVQRPGAFRESEAVCRKPLQALKRPEKNALDLSLHLLGNVRIVHTISRLLFCGQNTVTLKQTERRKKNKKIAAAVYLYQADNDGEWGELRFDFENGTAEIVRLADWDTVKSNIFAKTAIRFVQRLPEARLLKSVVVPFEMGISEKPALPTSTAKATKINPAHTISLRQTECRKTGETITAAVYQYLVDNDGEWGELRFDFENGTAEIVKLADWDTVKSNVFAKAAIQYVQYLLRQASTKQVIVLYVK